MAALGTHDPKKRALNIFSFSYTFLLICSLPSKFQGWTDKNSQRRERKRRWTNKRKNIYERKAKSVTCSKKDFNLQAKLIKIVFAQLDFLSWWKRKLEPRKIEKNHLTTAEKLSLRRWECKLFFCAKLWTKTNRLTLKPHGNANLHKKFFTF